MIYQLVSMGTQVWVPILSSFDNEATLRFQTSYASVLFMRDLLRTVSLNRISKSLLK